MNNTTTSLTAIVLTFNEELHLERCLNSLKDVCKEIVVVDSFSKDETENIAKKYGVRFYQNKWINYATQFNWAIKNTEINTDWVIRIDADEYIDEELQTNILNKLPHFNKEVIGLRIKRMMCFFDKPLKKGGMYPIWHLKIWRNKTAICEQRWMDERMISIVDGETESLKGNLIDNNFNKISWWTQKHNNYATREAIDVLDKIYNFTNNKLTSDNFFGTSEERRRWLKMRYLKMPLFVRPFLFFFIRYFLQGGFLEGKRGFIWSILQCFWYRFLVDVKIYEAYKYAGRDKEKLIEYFNVEYGYNITKFS
ncbi:glycosyltransferase family 2 protein [uncultured Polaribacter sp.]|uniref:glycosyltransferase family 2 protein n=1 Tax=uncultured Polaribacter sp. TaxID=174711 RepID=UPI00260D0043|nr:glycosyltransferase family 2 protein [uncultured Polaribacter sp.]